MIADRQEYREVTSSDIEDILGGMNADLILESIKTQIEDPMYSSTNFLAIYLDKFKVYKKMIDDEDFKSSLKDERNRAVEDIIDLICDKFELHVDYDKCTNKTKQLVCKTLYNFFILDYKENITNFIVQYIMKNKKDIISELKRDKSKTRDVTSITTKQFYNQNDAVLISGINFILFNIVPSLDYDADEVISLITESDDNFVYSTIQDMFNGEDSITISASEDFFSLFVSPITDRIDGWSEILSDVTMTMYDTVKYVNKSNQLSLTM